MTTYEADKNGMKYAKFSELRPMMIVTVDDGFDCNDPWSWHYVQFDTEQANNNDAFYINCKCGRHYLSGQLQDDGDTMIGIYLGKAKKIYQILKPTERS